MAEKKKHHKFHTTHVEHHKDKSHTVEHMHEDGPEHNVKHAVASLDHLHDSMEDHIGQPNPGEAEADGGDHGVPEAQAGPAGLPIPGGTPGAGA